MQKVRGDEVDVGRHLRGQGRNEVAIDLDGRKMLDTAGKTQGEDPWAGSNLEESVFWMGIDRGDELIGPVRHKKMLAEALTRSHTVGSSR